MYRGIICFSILLSTALNMLIPIFHFINWKWISRPVRIIYWLEINRKRIGEITLEIVLRLFEAVICIFEVNTAFSTLKSYNIRFHQIIVNEMKLCMSSSRNILSCIIGHMLQKMSTVEQKTNLSVFSVVVDLRPVPTSGLHRNKEMLSIWI